MWIRSVDQDRALSEPGPSAPAPPGPALGMTDGRVRRGLASLDPVDVQALLHFHSAHFPVFLRLLKVKSAKLFPLLCSPGSGRPRSLPSCRPSSLETVAPVAPHAAPSQSRGTQAAGVESATWDLPGRLTCGGACWRPPRPAPPSGRRATLLCWRF